MSLDAQRGARLQEERKRLGWSQQQAADLIGVRREMWAKYEAGAEPGADALAGMSEGRVDVVYVLTGRTQHQSAVELAASVVRSTGHLTKLHDKRGTEAVVFGELGSNRSDLEHDEWTLLDAYRKSSPAARHAIVSNAKAFAEEAAKAQAVKRKKT